MKKQTKTTKAELLKVKKEPVIDPSDLLSSGAITLDLAATGSAKGTFAKGKYCYMVGDSESGKSYIAMTTLAEASINEAFDKHDLVYWDIEAGMNLNVAKLFPSLTKRLKGNVRGYEDCKTPDCAEAFWDALDDRLNKGPCVAFLDSMDSLCCRAEIKKTKQQKNAAQQGDETVKGSYGTDKAKINSARLRMAIPKLRDTGSILVIISQTRDNIGFGARFNPKTRSGGNALTFYATLEVWTSKKGTIKRKVLDKLRQIGMVSQVVVKKNRVDGGHRTVTVPIYRSAGIDNIGAMIRFMIEEGKWVAKDFEKKPGVKITVPDWGVTLSEEKLVSYIVEEGLERELRDEVIDLWNEIEQGCKVVRPSRYTI